MLNRKAIVGIGAGVLVLGIVGCVWYSTQQKEEKYVEVTPLPTATSDVSIQIKGDTDSGYSFSDGETKIKKSKYGGETGYGQIVQGDYTTYNGLVDALKNQYGDKLEKLDFPKFTKRKKKETDDLVKISDANITYMLDRKTENGYTTYLIDDCVIIGTVGDYRVCVPSFGSETIIIFKNASDKVNKDLEEQGFTFALALNSNDLIVTDFGNYKVVCGLVDDVTDED